jgi:hypothetical protein
MKKTLSLMQWEFFGHQSGKIRCAGEILKFALAFVLIFFLYNNCLCSCIRKQTLTWCWMQSLYILLSIKININRLKLKGFYKNELNVLMKTFKSLCLKDKKIKCMCKLKCLFETAKGVLSRIVGCFTKIDASRVAKLQVHLC